MGHLVMRNAQYSSVSVLFVFTSCGHSQIKVPIVHDVAINMLELLLGNRGTGLHTCD